jgi:glycosyltransferase involved in cell wall biosynthesis
MKITFYNRPINIGHSIEAVFNILKEFFTDEVEYSDYYCTTKFKRLWSFYLARYHQGDINHITGDIHTLALFINPKKTLITVHDIGRYERDLRGIKKKMVKLIWLKLPLSRVSAITTISEFTKQKLISECGINGRKITVIPNPSCTDFPKSYAKFNSENPCILQIGSGNNKNIYRLIEAIKGEDFSLLLIRRNDEKLKSKLEEYKIKYEWLSDLSRSDIYKCYKKSDIVFFASEYEGFGVPILEANSVGRSIITSNLASMPEVAGDSAILVNPYSVSEIKNALFLLKLNKNVRNDLINKGFHNLKRYDPKKIAGMYQNIYDEILLKN